MVIDIGNILVSKHKSPQQDATGIKCVTGVNVQPSDSYFKYAHNWPSRFSLLAFSSIQL